jgi:uncharacterized membrane protein YsdA (DUF1294 family)/cold shock CspA family protein
MKKKGKIHHWNTSRGMGYIRNPQTGYDILFHRKDYRGSATPHEGETVWFDETITGDNTSRATAVSTVSGNADVHSYRPRHYIGRKSSVRTFMLLLILWGVLGLWGVLDLRLPLWAVAATLLVNLVTVYTYTREQKISHTSQARTPESMLHLLSLLGGWPGAGIAQTLLRYRSRKPSFQTMYWSSVALHFTVLLAWLFWLQPRIAM